MRGFLFNLLLRIAPMMTLLKQLFWRYSGVIGAFVFFVLITNPELIALFSVVAALGLDVFILLLLIQLRLQMDMVAVGIRLTWFKFRSLLGKITKQ